VGDIRGIPQGQGISHRYLILMARVGGEGSTSKGAGEPVH
jgi:hypothetical protein